MSQKLAFVAPVIPQFVTIRGVSKAAVDRLICHKNINNCLTIFVYTWLLLIFAANNDNSIPPPYQTKFPLY